MTAFNESKFSRSAHTVERKAKENSMAKRVVPQSQNPRTNTKSSLSHALCDKRNHNSHELYYSSASDLSNLNSISYYQGPPGLMLFPSN